MTKPTIVVELADGRQVVLTHENTTVHLFRGNSDLDHVRLTGEAGLQIIYDDDLVMTCARSGLPAILYSWRPGWSVDLKLRHTRLDFDSLLRDE